MSSAPHYRIDADRGLVHLDWGVLTDLTEWADLVDAMAVDRAYRRGFSILEDLRGRRHGLSQPMLDGWLRLLEEFALRVRPCRWAVVLPPTFLSLFNDVRQGADRLRRYDVDLCAFLDFDAALYWASRHDGIRKFEGG